MRHQKIHKFQSNTGGCCRATHIPGARGLEGLATPDERRADADRPRARATLRRLAARARATLMRLAARPEQATQQRSSTGRSTVRRMRALYPSGRDVAPKATTVQGDNRSQLGRAAPPMLKSEEQPQIGTEPKHAVQQCSIECK